MKLHNMNSAYVLAQTLYGVSPSNYDFEDMAIHAWELIGNKHTRLFKYQAPTVNKKLKLPCNVDIIESVHIPLESSQKTSNQTSFNVVGNLFIENYIEAWKQSNNPMYSKGQLVKYKEGDNELFFSRDYDNVMVVYHGIQVDEEDGLPLVSDKEIAAIANFVAYSSTYKDGIKKRDSFGIQLAQQMKVDWLRSCNAARVSSYMSLNDMDQILDVVTRWDRKQYGKSYKPIL